ncbi:hydrogenase maturation protease [Candidatus Woesearchaeota archaeon]|nr:hydrogenase maturation protease [Candidatus Woesearchaeota archaeon]
MSVKIFFIGNPLGGDDGIGPYLYNELKDLSGFKDFELHELGVIGLDLINYVDDNDKLIIIDALKTGKDVGKVMVLDEKSISNEFIPVSLHDLGVEQTLAILRMYKPKLERINIIGINVKNVEGYVDSLSDELKGKMPEIKKNVIKKVIEIAGEK